MSDARVLPPTSVPGPRGVGAPRPQSAPALLATLRAGIESLCARGLGQLDEEEPRADQAELAPRLAAAALALGGALARIGAQRDAQQAAFRPPGEPAPSSELSRASRLSEALHRYGTELPGLPGQPLSERQRLLAAGMRLCAAVGMELGPATPSRHSRAPSGIAPAPVASAPLRAPAAAPAGPAGTAPFQPAPSPASDPAGPGLAAAPGAASGKPSDAGRAPRRTGVADGGGEAPPLLRPLTGHPGIGPSTAEKLAARGLHRVIDALYFLPKRWDDLRQLVRVGELQPGVLQSTVVVVERSRVVWARRRFLEALLRGEDGEPLVARWFYYVGGMQRRLQPGTRFLLTGTPVRFRSALSIVHPELTDLAAPGASPLASSLAVGGPGLDGPAAEDPKGPELGRVRVRYPEVEGVPARTVERLCQSLCQSYAGEVPDGIPQTLLHKLSLPALPDALRALHLSAAELPPAQLELLNQGLAPPQRRLIFEELFFLQLGLCQRRRSARVETATPCHVGPEVLTRLRAVLPFTPTGAQERAIAELQRDLAQPHPMQRLLHGDVGSGKTLVAYAACELVMAAGHQAALMAPTEILAEQHKKTLTPWAEKTGRRVALLTATTPKTARKTTLALLQAGRFDDVWRLAAESAQPLDRETILAMLAAGFLHLVIGTHALLAERVEFADLGLVVIDEQHRFGVAQRAALRRKGVMPHLLVMTATPIPRTLALTLYGDLDVTQLDELPPGRTPPVTRVLSGRAGAARAVAALGRAVAVGRQAFWVCPLIEESDKIDLANATERHAALCAALPHCRVGLVHGRLNTDEREQVMEQFRTGALHILVATTVIEVGVDVPNASLMVVESAERFGLAQLHQLRGRIGRGAGPSACLLMHGSGASDESSDSDKLPSGVPARPAAADLAAELADEPAARASAAAGPVRRKRAARATAAPETGRGDQTDGPGELSSERSEKLPSERSEKLPSELPDNRAERSAAKDPAPPLGSGTTARARLEILARMSNGFHIAEADLRIRGPGEVLGTRQAGLPPLRYADLLRDLDLLQIARREAAALLSRDPDLSRPEHELMKRVLSERWASAEMTLE